MKKKAVILISGGLDSTVNLYLAHQTYEVVLGIHLSYGQLAAFQELQASEYFCQDLGVKFKVLDVSWISEFSSSALHDQNKIPQKEVDIFSHEASTHSASAVWVANRNSLFLNIAAVFAENLGVPVIIPGFNREEAQTFPDNTQAFLESLNEVFKFSTRNSVKVECLTIDKTKTEIVNQAMKLNIPLKHLWPCYLGGESWCLKCESCQRFLNACKKNGIEV